VINLDLENYCFFLEKVYPFIIPRVEETDGGFLDWHHHLKANTHILYTEYRYLDEPVMGITKLIRRL